MNLRESSNVQLARLNTMIFDRMVGARRSQRPSVWALDTRAARGVLPGGLWHLGAAILWRGDVSRSEEAGGGTGASASRGAWGRGHVQRAIGKPLLVLRMNAGEHHADVYRE